MILCDIGNSRYHFYEDGKIFHSNDFFYTDQEIYYISVNKDKEKALLDNNPDAIDIGRYVDFDTDYIGLGIDRIMACKSVENGVVVDAGSAITVDIMSQGIHLGGFILPGINAQKNALIEISDRLNKDINKNIDLSIYPQNTQDAISYGIIGSIVSVIRDVAKNHNIYFTGGDGEFLSKFFENSVYDEGLIFKSMLEVVKGIEK